MSRSTWAALLLVSLTGLALRLWGLGRESLWYDELFSWWITDGSFVQVLARTREDTGPPGHHLLLFVARSFLGSSEAAMRLPAAMLGALAVPAMFGLGRQLYGAREGLLAAALMAALRVPVAYGQEARAYAGLLCLSTLAGWAWVLLLRALERGDHWQRCSIAYALASIALAYFHYFGLVLVGVQAIATLVALRGNPSALRRAGALYVMIAGACAPWLPSLLAQLESGVVKVEWIGQATPAAAVALGQYLFGWPLPLTAGAYLLIAAYLLFLSPRRRGWRLAQPDLLLTWWLVAPVLLTYLVSILWVPLFKDRYLLIIAPAAYLLLARALVVLAGRRSRLVAGAALASILVALLLHLSVGRAYYASAKKPELREAVAHALELTPRTAPVYVIAQGWNDWMLDYYFHSLAPERAAPVGVSSFGRRIKAASLERVRGPFARGVLKRAQEAGATHLWIFEARPGKAATLAAAFEGELELLGKRRLHGLTVSVHAQR